MAKRSGGTGTASDRNRRMNARLSESGGKATSVRLTQRSVRILSLLIGDGTSQNEAINRAIDEAGEKWARE